MASALAALRFVGVAPFVVFVSNDTLRFGYKPFSGQDYCSLGVLATNVRCVASYYQFIAPGKALRNE
jgi:hypothetical protein